ncbi:MAG: hypothetical protein ACYCWW_03490 [Deltaproteobacteria bacterium]
MVCPICQGEFRDGFQRCATCDVALVDHLPELPEDGFRRLEALLGEGKAALSDPRSLEDAQRDQVLLHDARIPCLLYGNPAALAPSGAPIYYQLALLPEDVDLARTTITERRRKMLEAEGVVLKDSVVDLSAPEIACPACGFVFPKADECPDCGLFVGAGA